MRYSEFSKPKLNEGALTDVLGKIKNILSKVKSIVAPLYKFNFKQFSKQYQAKIKPISDKILQQILSGKSVSFEDISKQLQPLTAAASKEHILGESVELHEDVESIVAKMLSQLAAVFLSFVAILQSDFVIQNYKTMKANPSTMNDLMLKGSSFCLLYIVTGIAATLTLSIYYHMQGKKRDEREDQALAKQGLTKHY